MKSRTFRARDVSELVQDAATSDSPWVAKPGPKRPMPEYGRSPERAMAQRLVWRRNMLGWQESGEDDGLAEARRPLPEWRPTFVDAKGTPRRFGSVEPVDASFAQGQCAQIKPAGQGQLVPKIPPWCNTSPCIAGLMPRTTPNGLRCCKPNEVGPGCPCPVGMWPDPALSGKDFPWPCVPEPASCPCPPGQPCIYECNYWAKDPKSGGAMPGDFGGDWTKTYGSCTLPQVRESYVSGMPGDFLKVVHTDSSPLEPKSCGGA